MPVFLFRNTTRKLQLIAFINMSVNLPRIATVTNYAKLYLNINMQV